MTMQEYRAENPGLDHVPDEEVERLLDYQGWRLNQNLDRVGRFIARAFFVPILEVVTTIRGLFRG